MLVQQPPALALGIVHAVDRGPTKLQKPLLVARCDDEGGLHMGPLYDLAQEWLALPGQFCQVF
jgi:hypothetical protein